MRVSAQTKQRIVGIIVLSFLALIILPWLFGNNQPAVFEDKSTSQEPLPAGDLPEMVKEQAQAIKPVPNNVEHMAIPHKSFNSPKTIKNDDFSLKTSAKIEKINHPAGPAMSANTSKISAIQNDIVLTPPEVKTSTQKDIETRPTLVTAKTTQHKTEHIKAATPPRMQKNWTIQLGSFSNKVNADNLVKKLKVKGYPVYIKTNKNSAGDSITRVFVGPQEKHLSAETTATKIEKLFNVHGVIVKASI
jgi:cell division septation protein DedD